MHFEMNKNLLNVFGAGVILFSGITFGVNSLNFSKSEERTRIELGQNQMNNERVLINGLGGGLGGVVLGAYFFNYFKQRNRDYIN
jgi:hypothetical protein